jgi:hypothetical protein
MRGDVGSWLKWPMSKYDIRPINSQNTNRKRPTSRARRDC